MNEIIITVVTRNGEKETEVKAEIRGEKVSAEDVQQVMHIPQFAVYTVLNEQ